MSRAVSALLVLVALLAAGPALATDLSDEVEVADDTIEADLAGPTLFERITLLEPHLNVWQSFIVDSDFGSSEVDTFISGLRASVDVPVTGDFGVRLSTGVDAEYFNFRGSGDFLYTGRASGDPFDELLSHRMRLEGRYIVSPSWVVAGGGFMQSRVEAGASYGEGVTGGGFVAVGHELWGQLSIVLGLGMSSRLDQSGVGFSPIVQLRWKVNEELEVRSEGLGLRVIHRLTPKLSLDLAARFAGHRYRLDKRKGPVEPGDPLSGPVGKGTLRDRRFHVSTGVSWKFAPNWRLGGSVGMVAYQQYTSSDHNGKQVDQATANRPAFGCNFELRYRF